MLIFLFLKNNHNILINFKGKKLNILLLFFYIILKQCIEKIQENRKQKSTKKIDQKSKSKN